MILTLHPFLSNVESGRFRTSVLRNHLVDTLLHGTIAALQSQEGAVRSAHKKTVGNVALLERAIAELSQDKSIRAELNRTREAFLRKWHELSDGNAVIRDYGVMPHFSVNLDDEFTNLKSGSCAFVLLERG